jgi:hypothetical protein
MKIKEFVRIIGYIDEDMEVDFCDLVVKGTKKIIHEHLYINAKNPNVIYEKMITIRENNE